MRHEGFLWLAELAVIAAAVGVAPWPAHATEPAAADQPIDFTRDVRPILSDKCFHCHGPDPESRQADLRLDRWESADDLLGAGDEIVPGRPDESELVNRIVADDPEMRMPPASSPKVLKPEEIEILKRWVAQGAEFKPHWAFTAPVRPAVPPVKHADWPRNPIDAFVLARLEQENLAPAPRADALTLLRRLSLDLVGLPPSPEQIGEYQANIDRVGPDAAYRSEVARLLASPHYGERWGRVWLDAARYADSDGYEKDQPRDVWMYRDWVIAALNSDMPYDRFLIKQIAGDLLPNAEQSDLIATGFLRNSMVNAEGGTDPEQFRNEAMYDRMDAIGKAVLGLTLQCAQCHTHKYDPLTHTEYYQLFAFLNNCDEKQVAVYLPDEAAQRKQILESIAQIEAELKAADPTWPEKLAAWEAAARAPQAAWTVVRPTIDRSGGQKHYLLDDGSILAAGYAPPQVTTEFPVELRGPKITAVRLELLNDPSLPFGGPGRSNVGLCAVSGFRASAAPVGRPEERTKLKFKSATADVNPPRREVDRVYYRDLNDEPRYTGSVELAIDGKKRTGWGIDLGPGRSNVPRKAVFVLAEPLDTSSGVVVTFKLDQLLGQWYEFGPHNQNLGRFRLSITSDAAPTADPLPADVRAILAIPSAERTAEQQAAVFSYWRSTVPQWQQANERIDALWRNYPRGESQLVVGERTIPRMTHRLDRGNFLAPAEVVEPATPAFLHPLASDGSPNRLDFARWLADRRSPTTARAFVNRIWQAYFGTGLAATADDLGTQGDPPTHPELLDWLAVELMKQGWSQKHLHELIVLSATYQQASQITAANLARDPANRLLERGPRFRVDAETVRDIALAVSGLLNPAIGGPSVHPPAPAFLFKPPASSEIKPWETEAGDAKFRRAVYTFRYRSMTHPALLNFDAPTGEVSCPRRIRSNTPLQALTTLNEELFLDCARALATQIVAHGGTTDSERLSYAVWRSLGRAPRQAELTVLENFLNQQRSRFANGEADPAALVAATHGGEAAAEVPPAGGNLAELAAWTALARVVLNLDETITKE